MNWTFKLECSDCKYYYNDTCIHPNSMYCECSELWTPRENDDSETLWCEDCEYFFTAFMDGEGLCELDDSDTWYSCLSCENFKPKGEL